jgi:hypothetical protein
MTDQEYITLHVPLNPNHTLLGIGGYQLSHELRAWLFEHVGQCPPDNRAWYTNLVNDQYQWHHLGITQDIEYRNVRTFLFRNAQQAMMFKLTWAE